MIVIKYKLYHSGITKAHTLLLSTFVGVFLLTSAVYVHRLVLAENITPAVALPSNYKLVFQDEFNDDQLNSSKWSTCYEWYDTKYEGCSNYGNDESEWYKKSQVNVYNGNLTLTSLKKDTVGVDKNGNDHKYDYVSGMISTGRSTLNGQPHWQGKYGYYESKMKVPSGKAVWPAFWLLPTNFNWPPEIDIMEVLGQEPDKLITTYFWGTSYKDVQKDTKITDEVDLTKDWHTYGVLWEPGKIAWYLDGKVVRTVQSPNVPSTDMQILLNLAVGGNLPGSPDQTTPKNAQMLVDYVRVFQK